jgi:hypothetical protein
MHVIKENIHANKVFRGKKLEDPGCISLHVTSEIVEPI